MNEPRPDVSRRSLARYFLRLGAAGLGGPIALVGYMHRDLVEARGWITEDEDREGLALAQRSGRCFVGPALEAGSVVLLLQILGFFTYAGTFVFGSGLAIVPFLHGGVVLQHQWLTERQFLDAVAVALITPGPVVITTGFIGYLVAGFWGAVVAALGTFVPCYLFTILPAPYFKKHGKRPAIVAFVDGVTAAAIGAITGAVIVIGQRSITDWVTAGLAIGTAALLWRFKKLPEPLIVIAAALVGLLVHPMMTRA